MKKISILLFLLGLAWIIGCLFYFKDVLNVVDSDTMTISPSGDMVAKWPLFVGIIMVFVGSTFYYVSLSEKTAEEALFSHS